MAESLYLENINIMPKLFLKWQLQRQCIANLQCGHQKKQLWKKIIFDRKHWEKVSTNLDIFYKTFVCPALLNCRPITFCAKCDKALLEETEISTHGQSDLNSIQCDICGAWFH